MADVRIRRLARLAPVVGLCGLLAFGLFESSDALGLRTDSGAPDQLAYADGTPVAATTTSLALRGVAIPEPDGGERWPTSTVAPHPVTGATTPIRATTADEGAGTDEPTATKRIVVVTSSTTEAGLGPKTTSITVTSEASEISAVSQGSGRISVTPTTSPPRSTPTTLAPAPATTTTTTGAPTRAVPPTTTTTAAPAPTTTTTVRPPTTTTSTPPPTTTTTVSPPTTTTAPPPTTTTTTVPTTTTTIAVGGALRCPVQSNYNFIDTYGAPRSGGRTHQGTDIFAPNGTPVLAPEAGRVVHRTNNLGGNVYYLYAADGTYYYGAHLSGFGTSGDVAAGTVIGYVGSSGNASATYPHLHFEIHPQGGASINPYPILIGVC